MVLRDSNGNIIFSACRVLFSRRDALEAELCACMEGLSFSLQRSNCPISIEMDSIVAVKLVQSREVDGSVYSSIVTEIRYLLSLHESCITHISRSQNRVSDSLANFAHTKGRTKTWLGSGPEETVQLAADDCNSMS